ncbi:hypothetical protein COV40_00700 [Candidatus Berkelbacteria bacterium CG11_big_fil_rev_8_21_14_0_20_42_15]|uniref:DUF3800 domain-containing protein n=1 Tax=Candidatus Berkelbacteria bacterium CG11_big_fil_rev_8_21_14_0_20_42_15 TaxID=1974517 RepID=A0A2H0Q0Y3_9BACT|nr:MAG: hypothetical protein COV40_00700 [Candidatus Berkelbacteria bacterium CG11_big_fil_rev_8_21_14_0_20_42_15]
MKTKTKEKMPTKTEKIYCYVDETGQDTNGKLFIVVTVVCEKDNILLEEFLEQCEIKSKRHMIKWTKSKASFREQYLELISGQKLINKIYYGIYQDTKAYVDLTAIVIAQSLHIFAKNNKIKDFKATIIIDGLNKKESRSIRLILKRAGVGIEKVRGIKDEASALIRLADSIGGLLRDSIGGSRKMNEIAKKFVNKRIIKKL